LAERIRQRKAEGRGRIDAKWRVSGQALALVQVRVI
jgi:hypothetical protein